MLAIEKSHNINCPCRPSTSPLTAQVSPTPRRGVSAISNRPLHHPIQSGQFRLSHWTKNRSCASLSLGAASYTCLSWRSRTSRGERDEVYKKVESPEWGFSNCCTALSSSTFHALNHRLCPLTIPKLDQPMFLRQSIITWVMVWIFWIGPELVV